MDHLINYFDVIFTGLGILCFFGLICIILQKLFPSIPDQRIYRQAFFTDLSFWLLITITALTVTTPAVDYLIKPYEDAGIFSAPLKSISIYLKILLCIMAVDFIAYWVHRLFHMKYLWKFHAIHHSPLEIDWLSSARFHPIESIIQIMVMYSFGIALGFSFSEVAIALVTRSWYGYFVHSNLSWSFGKGGRFIASPYFHRWHHTVKKEALDKNFAGVFSLWDYIFRTAYNPKARQPEHFGIGHKIGDNLWDYLKYPFTK